MTAPATRLIRRRLCSSAAPPLLYCSRVPSSSAVDPWIVPRITSGIMMRIRWLRECGDVSQLERGD